jgi:hypothetical protein
MLIFLDFRKSVSLFDGNDSEEDLFAEKIIPPVSKSANADAPKSEKIRVSLFGDSDEEDFLAQSEPTNQQQSKLFKDSSDIANQTTSAEDTNKQDKELFDDSKKLGGTVPSVTDPDDGSYIQASVKSTPKPADRLSLKDDKTKTSLFVDSDSDGDDILFSSASSGSSRSSKLLDSTKVSTRHGLFDDFQVNRNDSSSLFDDEDDLFGPISRTHKKDFMQSQEIQRSHDGNITADNKIQISTSSEVDIQTTNEEQLLKKEDSPIVNLENNSDYTFTQATHSSKTQNVPSNVKIAQEQKFSASPNDIFSDNSKGFDDNDLFNSVDSRKGNLSQETSTQPNFDSPHRQIESSPKPCINITSADLSPRSDNSESEFTKLESPKDIFISNKSMKKKNAISLFDSDEDSTVSQTNLSPKTESIAPKKPEISKKPNVNTSVTASTVKISDTSVQQTTDIATDSPELTGNLRDKTNVTPPKTLEVSSPSIVSIVTDDDLFSDLSHSSTEGKSGLKTAPKGMLFSCLHLCLCHIFKFYDFWRDE